MSLPGFLRSINGVMRSLSRVLRSLRVFGESCGGLKISFNFRLQIQTANMLTCDSELSLKLGSVSVLFEFGIQF